MHCRWVGLLYYVSLHYSVPAVFDDSGNFLLYATMVGVKGEFVVLRDVPVSLLTLYHTIQCLSLSLPPLPPPPSLHPPSPPSTHPPFTVINLLTNKCVRVIGKVRPDTLEPRYVKLKGRVSSKIHLLYFVLKMIP